MWVPQVDLELQQQHQQDSLLPHLHAQQPPGERQLHSRTGLHHYDTEGPPTSPIKVNTPSHFTTNSTHFEPWVGAQEAGVILVLNPNQDQHTLATLTDAIAYYCLIPPHTVQHSAVPVPACCGRPPIICSAF